MCVYSWFVAQLVVKVHLAHYLELVESTPTRCKFISAESQLFPTEKLASGSVPIVGWRQKRSVAAEPCLI